MSSCRVKKCWETMANRQTGEFGKLFVSKSLTSQPEVPVTMVGFTYLGRICSMTHTHTHTTALSQPFANLCVLLLPLLIGNTQRFLHEDGNRLHEKTWGKYGLSKSTNHHQPVEKDIYAMIFGINPMVDVSWLAPRFCRPRRWSVVDMQNCGCS